MPRLGMSGGVPQVLLYAFMAWTGKTLPYLLPLQYRTIVKPRNPKLYIKCRSKSQRTRCHIIVCSDIAVGCNCSCRLVWSFYMPWKLYRYLDEIMLFWDIWCHTVWYQCTRLYGITFQNSKFRILCLFQVLLKCTFLICGTATCIAKYSVEY
jgi:hypothetical protein